MGISTAALVPVELCVVFWKLAPDHMLSQPPVTTSILLYVTHAVGLRTSVGKRFGAMAQRALCAGRRPCVRVMFDNSSSHFH